MMKNNTKKYRCSIRLKDYDYSQVGMYFITICAKDRKNLFGKINNEDIILNKLGKIVEKYWNEISAYYLNIKLDEFIIMPNHVHGIIFIIDNTAGASPAPTENDVFNVGATLALPII